ncbi:ADR149Wp [Eremothecium gossypii ATCC 10895]|uniref:ADR149Wp n=1 Tax=Eremothecium gossypii (strain ATCC 10895 / CBS 109.51 / FGSC 9923 / NRRL Y-1056) TaxID=284811 RepID=Q759X4_EREGS|nr:ADR149Wp [Eremothecium gossypii ATCC 10895]AAS52069.2 ADR149Wp [Eremothecium gossypii ATCC 10895]AEY96368.1 FADR149Wp [Eremothecium gossypii FDAG1]
MLRRMLLASRANAPQFRQIRTRYPSMLHPDHFSPDKASSVIGNIKNITDPEHFEEHEKPQLPSAAEQTDLISGNMLDVLTAHNPGFKRSQANLRRLKTQVSDHALPTEHKIRAIFRYLLQESQDELSRLRELGPEKVNTVLQAHRENAYLRRKQQAKTAEDLAGLMAQELLIKDAKGDSYLQNTEHLLLLLLHMLRSKSQVLEIEQIVEALETCKLIPGTQNRLRGIFLSGRLLYSLGKVRMDPFNESFYIDALLYHGCYKDAWQLFESYKDRVNQRWWYELGMIVALRSNQVRKYDLLFKQTIDKFGESYIQPKVLKTAIKKKLYMGDFKSANRLTNFFMQIGGDLGFKKATNDGDTSNIPEFETEEQANQFLNALENPTYSDVMDIIQAHLFRRNHAYAFKLFAQFLEQADSHSTDVAQLLVRLQMLMINDIQTLKKAIQPFLKPNTEQEALSKLEESFNFSIEKTGLSDARRALDFLLFRNMEALTSQPTMTGVVYKYIVQNWADSKNDNSIDPSKKFQGIIKILLINNKEDAALQVLSKLEQSDGSGFYPRVNGHHYSLLADYYLKALKSTKSVLKRERLVDKVRTIMNRMEKFSIPFNATITASLIAFYREVPDIDECFKLINSILVENSRSSEVAMNNVTPFFEMRLVTSKLYQEIWKTYRLYHSFSADWSLLEPSAYRMGWKSYVLGAKRTLNSEPTLSMSELFRQMVELNNIMPTPKFYSNILITLAKGRDFVTMIAVLQYMKTKHAVVLEDALRKYLYVSLERAYVELERKGISSGNSVLAFQSATALAKEKVKSMIQEGQVLKKVHEDPIDDMVSQISSYIQRADPTGMELLPPLLRSLGLDMTPVKQ